MDDKEKVRKALAKITKLIDEIEVKPMPDENDQWDIEHYNKIKNELLDSTSSDEMKVKRALAEIYGHLNTLLDIGCSSGSDQVMDLKKVKSILGQIPAKEEELRDFYIGMRNER